MLLKTIFQTIKSLIPVVGEIQENIKSNTDASPYGHFSKPAFIKQIVRLLIALVAVYLFATGKLSVDEVKDLTNQ